LFSISKTDKAMAAKAFREVQEKRPKFSEKEVADETLEFEKKL